MKNINSSVELYEELNKMNVDNAVSKFNVPGKGNFTLVYEEKKGEKTIQEEVESDAELKGMLHESQREYSEGRYRATREIVESIYNEDSRDPCSLV